MGKVVDLGALQLQNENTRAVGNMKVNARGDLIDGWNKPIHRRPQQVQKQYDRQVTNVVDTDNVQTHQAGTKSAKATRAPKPQSTETKEPVLQSEPAVTARAESEPVEVSSKADSTPTEATGSSGGGLADAIARARRIQQQPLPTPRQLAQNQSGVKKI